MEKLTKEAEDIMNERFGKDNIIALATSNNNMPHVRYVNSYYENKTFYVITYGKSGKMKDIDSNPNVSIAGDWFTATAKARNLGWFKKEDNKEIANKLRIAFKEWIDNGHNNYDDENTIILALRLTEGILMSHGIKYEIDFSE